MTIVDLQRRQKVMARSQALQHCVCNPQKSCPCDIFINHNICPCAGEKLPAPLQAIALTKTVSRAGCASKIPQGELIGILNRLPPISDPRVLLGAAAGDDCGVYQLDDEMVLVQTVDVFTPCVDDPYLFGQIAAANSLSDVYAMGGRPLTALSVVGFPIDDYDSSTLEAMLRGGIDKLNEAGCALIGGHSMNDQEIKMGFAVTGLMERSRVIQRGQARAGDLLVLTKPIGTGMISFGAQIGRLDARDLEEAGLSMAALNRDAAELMQKFEAHACTDVTGFGLAGHLIEMVRFSGVSAEVDLAQVPVFAAVPVCLENEILPGAIERNQEYAMAWVQAAAPGIEKYLPILYDPQTSGGLLLAMPEEKAAAYVDALQRCGHRTAAIIGRIVEKKRQESEIFVIHSKMNGEGSNLQNKDDRAINAAAGPTDSATSTTSSCCSSSPAVEGNVDNLESLAIFSDFMEAASRAGRIDARSKKLMAVALSAVQRCGPCLKSHMKSALTMGISKDELDEAVLLAVAFGGATVLNFYREICREIKIDAI
jgi:selenide, water dikinase